MKLLSESPPIVVDVRLADDFPAGRIAAAINNCVFEVAFHERLASQVTDKSQRIMKLLIHSLPTHISGYDY